MRPRNSNPNNLPPCLYFKNGRHWFVKRRVWHDMGKTREEAIARYNEIVNDQLLSERKKLQVANGKINGLKRRIEILEHRLKEQKTHQTRERDKLRAMFYAALTSQSVSSQPGIYLMCSGEDIVYIGMSKSSVAARVSDRSSLVDFIRMIPADPQECVKEEGRWINLLQPKGNRILAKKATLVDLPE